MMALIAAVALQSAAAAQPADSTYIKCAFEKAGELATATAETPESVADKVLIACTSNADGEPITDATRARIRAAALAMVNRKRGTDGQAADAPIRLPETTVRREASIDIPDEIAPAVIPYFRCRIASTGVPLYTEGKKSLIPPPAGISKGSDCSGARAKAAQDADKMLKRARRMKSPERAAFIERVLASIDVIGRPPPTATD